MPRRTAEEAARTRDAVLDAAMQVFAERGFAAAQFDEMARRASVTRGAIYHHFSDKAELYLAVLRERWEPVMAHVIGELSTGKKPLPRLTAFVRAFLRAVDTDARVRALLRMSLSGDVLLAGLQEHASEKRTALDSWAEAIAKPLAELGAARDAGARARALLISLIGYATWAALGAARDEPASRDTLADLFLRGVLP
jgi:TetR/AcrR family acrAB operon transcriptional repressor